MLNAVPAVMLEGPLITKWVAAAGLTWMYSCRIGEIP
jgi:hypothetical protein